MLQKDFAYASLEKKQSTSLQASLNSYIKALNYSYFSLPSEAWPAKSYIRQEIQKKAKICLRSD